MYARVCMCVCVSYLWFARYCPLVVSLKTASDKLNQFNKLTTAAAAATRNCSWKVISQSPSGPKQANAMPHPNSDYCTLSPIPIGYASAFASPFAWLHFLCVCHLPFGPSSAQLKLTFFLLLQQMVASLFQFAMQNS